MTAKQGEILLRGRLNGSQRVRLIRLLDMLYKPSELASVVGFNRRQVYRVYVPFGCPHERDQGRHLWINGKLFREWYEIAYPRSILSEDEAFCLTCRKAVRLHEAVRQRRGRLVYWVSTCPTCGRRLARIITRVRRESDRSGQLEAG
jgi:hypothetical protein